MARYQFMSDDSGSMRPMGRPFDADDEQLADILAVHVRTYTADEGDLVHLRCPDGTVRAWRVSYELTEVVR
jgi:hypothetical protein